MHFALYIRHRDYVFCLADMGIADSIGVRGTYNRMTICVNTYDYIK